MDFSSDTLALVSTEHESVQNDAGPDSDDDRKRHKENPFVFQQQQFVRLDILRRKWIKQLIIVGILIAAGVLLLIYLFVWRGEKYAIMEFKGALNIGQKIIVIGTPTEDAVRFDVNLNCAINGDIALHIAIHCYSNGPVAVFNCMRNNRWDKEHEMIGKSPFPFKKSEKFEMIISCEETGYEIEVNGEYFATFGHRLSPSSVQSVSIVGEVDQVTVADI